MLELREEPKGLSNLLSTSYREEVMELIGVKTGNLENLELGTLEVKTIIEIVHLEPCITWR